MGGKSQLNAWSSSGFAMYELGFSVQQFRVFKAMHRLCVQRCRFLWDYASEQCPLITHLAASFCAKAREIHSDLLWMEKKHKSKGTADCNKLWNREQKKHMTHKSLMSDTLWKQHIAHKNTLKVSEWPVCFLWIILLAAESIKTQCLNCGDFCIYWIFWP